MTEKAILKRILASEQLSSQILSRLLQEPTETILDGMSDDDLDKVLELSRTILDAD